MKTKQNITRVISWIAGIVVIVIVIVFPLQHFLLLLGIVSMSLGVATFDSNESISHEKLFIQADQALYLAKEKGRNRVEVWAAS